VYTDIVGEFESNDDWIVQPDEEPSTISPPSTSNQLPQAAAGLENVEIFGTRPSPHPVPAWRRTASGQLWEAPTKTDDRWYDGPLRLQIGLDYLFFSRGAAADNFFASNDIGDTFSLADIDPGHETTLRYRFLIANDGGTGFEITGYEFEEFNGSLALEGEGITPQFFGGIPADPADAYVANYKSRLTNIEANAWRRSGERLKLGLGLRHFKLEEEFDIEISADQSSTGTTTGTSENGFFSDTENKIFGAQLMARVYRPVTNKVYLEGGVNGGYGFNRITTDSDTANIDSHTEENTGTGFFSFNGGVTLRPMDGLSLRAGYEGLLLTDVALSPDQSQSINAFSGTGEIQTGELYFGGAYFGGTISF
jgi:opacity protein-like surface antigen